MSVYDDNSDASWVIDSKFAPSRPGLDLVERQHLLNQLQDGAARKLVLVVAPAGYGKSSLLGQWAREAEGTRLRVVWLTLDAEDSESKVFLAYMVLSLARAGVQLDDLVTGARNAFSDSAIDVVLIKLIRHLNAIDQTTVLILEDYHRAECPETSAIIQQLLRSVVSPFALFIDSRKQPDINAMALIASGDAIEIDATQLRLTREETFRALSGVAEDAALAEIYEKTEGWPVAVQLAKLQLRTQPSAALQFDAKNGLIASYLTEEVLSSLDETAQTFLLTVSFLDRFSPELTGFVMDMPDIWDQIQVLPSFAALIIPQDREGHWYRLHHLFAEYLKELQVRRDPARPAHIQKRASTWYALRNDITRAVKYSADAQDFDQCKKIIQEAGGWRIILTISIGTLRSILRQLPPQEISNSAEMLIAKAYLHCKDGEIHEARAQLDAAVQHFDNQSDDDLMADRVVVESMINLYEDKVAGSADYITRRQELIESGRLSALEQGTIFCEDCIIALSHGDLDSAEAKLRQAFALMRQSGSVLGLNYCYIHAGHLALHRADFDMAAANIDRALSMAEENFGADSGLKNLALVLHFSMKAWQGRSDAQDLTAFTAALTHVMKYDGWCEIYMTGLEAFRLLAAQCHDPHTSLRLTRQLMVFGKERGLTRFERFAQILSTSQHHLYERTANMSDEDIHERFGKRDWQIFIQWACINTDPEMLSRADDMAVKMGAALKGFTIRLAIARQQNEVASRDLSILLNVVKAAARQDIVGPFLADENLLQGLRDLRWQLRSDERELITVQFIEAVLQRASTLHPSKSNRLLSERELEILSELASGQSNKEIARALELTENTVKFHLKSIYTKLNVSKRTQAVLEAQKQGLIVA